MSAKVGYGVLCALLTLVPRTSDSQIIDMDADAHFVYEISVPGAEKATEISTAFKMAGTSGLITTLHSVLGGPDNITATNFADSNVSFPMKLVDVDTELDLARLEPVTTRANGFPSVESGFVSLPAGLVGRIQPKVKYEILGEPAGLRKLPRSGTFTEVSRPLSQVTPVSADLGRRKSPALKTTVWSLIGANTFFGDSGAPVFVWLDGAQYVIGVVDGGLSNMRVGDQIQGFDYAWASQFVDLQWTPRDGSAVYRDLSHNNVAAKIFFSYKKEVADPPLCEDHINEACLADSVRLYIDPKSTPRKFHEMYLWLTLAQGVRKQIANVKYTIELRKTDNHPIDVKADERWGAAPSIGLDRFEYKSCDERMANSQMEVDLKDGKTFHVSLNLCATSASDAGALPNEVSLFRNPPHR